MKQEVESVRDKFVKAGYGRKCREKAIVRRSWWDQRDVGGSEADHFPDTSTTQVKQIHLYKRMTDL